MRRVCWRNRRRSRPAASRRVLGSMLGALPAFFSLGYFGIRSAASKQGDRDIGRSQPADCRAARKSLPPRLRSFFGIFTPPMRFGSLPSSPSACYKHRAGDAVAAVAARVGYLVVRLRVQDQRRSVRIAQIRRIVACSGTSRPATSLPSAPTPRLPRSPMWKPSGF